MSTPAQRPPQRPTGQPVRSTASPSRPPSSGGGSLLGALKLFVALGVIGGGGWFAYTEYEKRNKPEPVVAEVPKPVEKIPEPEATLVVPNSVVVEKPVVTADPVATEKPVETPKLAPLPALPALHKPEALAALSEATKSRIQDGRWADHITVVKAVALLALNERPRTAGAAQLDKLSEKPTFVLGLAQIAAFEALGEKAFAEFAKPGDDFAERFLNSAEMTELFVNNLVPEDDAAAVLRIWKSLDSLETKPEARALHLHLAVALALIHDKPGGEEPAAEAYAYYRKERADKKLYYDFTKIKPDELVWAVAPDQNNTPSIFKFSDREWALGNLTFPLAKIGDAYASIAYRMNHAEYPEYTMANVRKMGGICWNQAGYSQSNGRARGVPCAYMGGEGSRGGHAWFGYKSPRGWVNTVGRYNDGYACGHATNPQTGKRFREWDFFLFDDEGRHNGDREASLRLIRAAALVKTNDERLALLESAARRNQNNPAAWEPWVAALLAEDKPHPIDFWEKIVNEYRIRLKKSPDFFALSDRIESEKIFPKTDADKVSEFLRKRRRQSIRENPARFDLLTESVKREAAYYASRKDDARVKSLYANSLREYGDNLPAFIRLSEDFAALAADNPDLRKAGLPVIEMVFNKEVDTKLKGDAFSLGMQAKAAAKLADIFKADGDAKKAEKYAARAEVIAAKAKEIKGAML